MTSPVRFLVVSDFDGTITEIDTLDLIVRSYAPEAWKLIEPRLHRGEITLSEAVLEEFRHVRVTQEEVIDFILERVRVRPGFKELVAWLEAQGHEFMVVSAGFRVIIDRVLSREGLGCLRVCSGEARFTPGGTTVTYPSLSPLDCVSDCGICKRHAVEKATSPGAPVVYIGDGMSDYCAAAAADVIFARRYLAKHLTAQGRAFFPFDDFYEVKTVLERLGAG